MIASALLSCALAALPAAGPRLVVTPAILEVQPHRPWGDVTVRNESGEAQIVTTGVYEWTQDVDGFMYLRRAADAFPFPESAALAPGETRRFRISVVGRAAERERAYRLALDVGSAVGGDRTQVLVPVFVAPPVPLERATLEVTCFAVGRCRAVVENSGTTHVRAVRVSVSPDETHGANGLEHEGSWVLAGERRAFSFETPGWHHVVARVAVLGPVGVSTELHAAWSDRSDGR